MESFTTILKSVINAEEYIKVTDAYPNVMLEQPKNTFGIEPVIILCRGNKISQYYHQTTRLHLRTHVLTTFYMQNRYRQIHKPYDHGY